MATFDPERIRTGFPLLEKLIYLENAATSLSPRQIIEAQNTVEYTYRANVGRGAHRLSRMVTHQYEEARETLKRFLGGTRGTLAFTKNTTEAVNIVAQGVEWNKTDRIITTLQDHHSNLLPWYRLKNEGKIAAFDTVAGVGGVLRAQEIEDLITPDTRLVALGHASNVFGTIAPAAEIAKICQDHNILLLLDGAQTAPLLVWTTSHATAQISQAAWEPDSERSQAFVSGPRGRVPLIGTVSFTVDGVHPHEVAYFLDEAAGIMVRSGEHCCQPLMHRLGLTGGTVRAQCLLLRHRGRHRPADCSGRRECRSCKKTMTSHITEKPVQIIVNGRAAMTLMTAPDDPLDLIVGQLFTERVITSYQDIASLHAGEVQTSVVTTNPFEILLSRKTVLAGCGGAASFLDTGSLGVIDSELRVSCQQILGRCGYAPQNLLARRCTLRKKRRAFGSRNRPQLPECRGSDHRSRARTKNLVRRSIPDSIRTGHRRDHQKSSHRTNTGRLHQLGNNNSRHCSRK